MTQSACIHQVHEQQSYIRLHTCSLLLLLLQVKEALGSAVDSQTVLACFLVQEGANIHARNIGGVSASDKLNPQLRAAVMSFLTRKPR